MVGKVFSHNERCQAGARAPGSCRSETHGKLGWNLNLAPADSKVSQDSLLEVFSFSFRILSFAGSPDSILTVLVIAHLTTSQTGPLHPATVGFRPTDLSAGRPITSLRSRRILNFNGFPPSILTVLGIASLTMSQTGPLHPATVGLRVRRLRQGRARRLSESAGRPIKVSESHLPGNAQGSSLHFAGPRHTSPTEPEVKSRTLKPRSVPGRQWPQT
jgi:hypothetical protein